MTASPARSLIERAAEAYGFDEAWGLAPPVSRSLASVSPIAPKVPPAPEADPATAEPAYEPVADRDAAEPPVAVARALAAAGFVIPGTAPTALSEELRIVKRPILAGAFGTEAEPALAHGRLLLVASGGPGEGKTFCAANLALSLAAEPDVDVLLVDGDIAKPSLAELFGVPAGSGLMDCVADPALDPEQVAVATGIAGLRLLGAGRSINDATELLASRRGAAFFERLAAHDPRRIVVIDSPPVLAASPATALALHAGQTVLVVRADTTTEGDLREAYALLSRCPTIHLLLNAVTYGGGAQRFGSYYGAAA